MDYKEIAAYPSYPRPNPDFIAILHIAKFVHVISVNNPAIRHLTTNPQLADEYCTVTQPGNDVEVLRGGPKPSTWVACRDGRLIYQLKQRWCDGTTHVAFEPLELLEKLAAMVPHLDTMTVVPGRFTLYDCPVIDELNGRIEVL